MERDIDLTAMSGERLIDRVIDHLLSKMIGPRCVGVHSGALAHRL